ncbi:hypothetical protein UC8_38540 [Roseimaritima ulvae]|uniref:Uncharacterized protein n=1 Tax=Roseimaritima ulvae TaxID=980254 RepID=A0A5B9QXI2_9BACT|nr:hypothetical protein UC8_38540 [Roseimaritima ulvae]
MIANDNCLALNPRVSQNFANTRPKSLPAAPHIKRIYTGDV